MTTDPTTIDAGANIIALHQEIEQLHQESLQRLNRLAWQCNDLLTLCEVLGQELERRRPEDKRARMARVVLSAAANDTSRKLAIRFVCPWFSDELSEALERVSDPQRKGAREQVQTN